MIQLVFVMLWRRLPPSVRQHLIWMGTSHYIATVSAVCLNAANQILLLEHRLRLDKPWDLPGGIIKRGEQPIDAIRRELYEETGLDSSAFELLVCVTEDKQLSLAYLCYVPDTDLILDLFEIVGYRWVDPVTCTLDLGSASREAVAVVARRIREG